MLRVALLTGRSSGCAARVAHYLARVQDPPFEIVGAVLDTQRPSGRSHQLRRLDMWRKSGGTGYMLWRLWLRSRDRLTRHPPSAYSHSLEDLGREFGFPVKAVSDINSSESASAVASFRSDVALSIENRILRESMFTIPPLGTLNLHYGRIPDFRGIPPAFWELFHGEQTMSVTVHRVDQHVDHGDVLEVAEVPIVPADDARTLFQRALSVDYQVVESALRGLAEGNAQAKPIDWSQSRLNTLPSWRDLRGLRRRLGRTVAYGGAARASLDEIPVQR